jgi:hypothetical protein
MGHRRFNPFGFHLDPIIYCLDARTRTFEKPGFIDHPEGFEIDQYPIGKDHWEEGFFTE